MRSMLGGRRTHFIHRTVKMAEVVDKMRSVHHLNNVNTGNGFVLQTLSVLPPIVQYQTNESVKIFSKSNKQTIVVYLMTG